MRGYVVIFEGDDETGHSAYSRARGPVDRVRGRVLLGCSSYSRRWWSVLSADGKGEQGLTRRSVGGVRSGKPGLGPVSRPAGPG